MGQRISTKLEQWQLHNICEISHYTLLKLSHIATSTPHLTSTSINNVVYHLSIAWPKILDVDCTSTVTHTRQTLTHAQSNRITVTPFTATALCRATIVHTAWRPLLSSILHVQTVHTLQNVHVVLTVNELK